MNIILYACIIGYVISESDLDQAYQYLVQHQDQLMLGQWTASSDYLVYINVVYDNQNLIMQVYPKKHNLLHEKHYFRLSYSLLNTSYHFDSNQNLMTWENIDVIIELQNNQKHPLTICKATLQLEVQTKTVILHSQFAEQCYVTEERIRLFIFSNSTYQMQVVTYSMLLIFISIVQIISTYFYLKSDPAANQGASMTISIVLTQDIFICIFSSLLFDLPRYYYFFPCLICQLLAIFCDLKLKAKLTNMERQKKRYLLLQIVEILSVTFLFLRIRHSIELTLLNIFLVPQIAITFYTGERQRFNIYYIGAIFPRALLSIYARGFQDNILQLLQKLHVVFVIILILVIQFLIYYCQNQFGWFILKRNKYNYFIKQTDEHTQSDCAICLLNLSQIPEYTLDKGEPFALQTINQASRNNLLMKTPCVNNINKLESLISPFLFKLVDVNQSLMPIMQKCLALSILNFRRFRIYSVDRYNISQILLLIIFSSLNQNPHLIILFTLYIWESFNTGHLILIYIFSIVNSFDLFSILRRIIFNYSILLYYNNIIQIPWSNFHIGHLYYPSI